MTARRQSDGVTVSTTIYEYDGFPHLRRLVTEAGGVHDLTISYDYAGSSILRTVVYEGASQHLSGTMSWEYDPEGRVTKYVRDSRPSGVTTSTPLTCANCFVGSSHR